MSVKGLLLTAVAMLAMVQAEEEGDVVVLTPDNFHTYVGNTAGAFVEFYAPWCGHCKALAPDWSTLGTTFKSSRSEVVIGKVDADAHRELAGAYDVRGYPTLKWFPANSKQPEDYNGGRTIDELIEFVNSKTGLRKKVKSVPTSVVALTTETFDAIVNDPTKHKLVEFYAPWCGHCKNLAPIYEKLGSAYEGEKNVLIAKVDADKYRDLGERFGVQGFPTIKYIPAKAGRPEELAEDYNGGRDGESFVSFLNEKAGTARTFEGGLLPTAGRLPDFDDLVQEFIKSKSRSTVLAEAQEIATSLDAADKAKADNYLRIMGKIIEKGDGYITTEAKRIDGMLASDSINKQKKTELLLKRNVLEAFSA